MKEPEIKRGQPITFRVPSDTPEHMLKYLQRLKKTERRNFSSKIAEFVMNGVSGSLAEQKETLAIPLPKSLSKAQRDWLKHEHSEALLGSIVYQLLSNPIRTASLFATLNSATPDKDEVPYLQGESAVSKEMEMDKDLGLKPFGENGETGHQEHLFQDDLLDDDLDDFDWETAKDSQKSTYEDKTESLDDLLGDFLAQMNK
jgi:hypothetical protein